MSEHIAHLAVFDDCARLALHSPEICRAFKESLNKHWEVARLASIARGGDRNSVHFMKVCRDNWQTRKDGDFIEEKLAFLLGWRCHNAADRMFKPVYRLRNPEHYLEEREGVSDIRIYHDVIVFREVYGNGTKEPFLPSFLEFRMQSHPAAEYVNVERAEDLFGAMWQRTLLEQHSIVSEELDLDERLKLTFDRLQDLYVEVKSYAEAFYHPDPNKLRQFIFEPNFYDRTDPIIKLARSYQDGQSNRIDLQSALKAAASQSQYAQALEWGYRYLKVGSDYFERKISEQQFRELSDLDKPHVPSEIYEWLDTLRAKS